MNIYSELTTVDKIINERKSITRFGDGEFFHVFNNDFSKSSGRQKTTPEIKQKLIEILNSNNDNLIIGISGYLNSVENVEKLYNDFSPYMRKFIKKIKLKLEKNYPELYNKNFYSAEITRIYNLKQNQEIIDKFNSFFSKNEFIFVGNKMIINLIKENFINLFKSIEFIEVPKINAFGNYSKIFNNCINHSNSKNSIFLLSIGITATILSYELSILDLFAIDFGHYFELLNKLNKNKKCIT